MKDIMTADPDQPKPEETTKSQERAMSELWVEVEKLKSRVEEEKKGFLGWIRKYGLLIAFAGGLLAIPRGAFDLLGVVKDSFLGVEIESADVPLTVLDNTDTKAETVEYRFSVKIRNRSSAEYEVKLNEVEIVPANLSVFEPGSTKATAITCFDSTDDEIVGKSKVSTPLAVAGRSQKIIRCQAMMHPGHSIDALFAKGDKQRLVLRFTGGQDDEDNYTIDFCFLSPGREKEQSPGVFDCT